MLDTDFFTGFNGISADQSDERIEFTDGTFGANGRGGARSITFDQQSIYPASFGTPTTTAYVGGCFNIASGSGQIGDSSGLLAFWNGSSALWSALICYDADDECIYVKDSADAEVFRSANGSYPLATFWMIEARCFGSSTVGQLEIRVYNGLTGAGGVIYNGTNLATSDGVNNTVTNVSSDFGGSTGIIHCDLYYYSQDDFIGPATCPAVYTSADGSQIDFFPEAQTDAKFPLVDDFHYANGPLNNPTKWIDNPSNNLVIVSNTAQDPTNGGKSNGLVQNYDTNFAFFVEADIDTTPLTGAVNIYWNAGLPSYNGYYLKYRNFIHSLSLELFKVTSGVFPGTSIAGPFAIADVTGNIVGLTRDRAGNFNIFKYVSSAWTQLGSVNDSTHTGTARVSLGLDANSSNVVIRNLFGSNFENWDMVNDGSIPDEFLSINYSLAEDDIDVFEHDTFVAPSKHLIATALRTILNSGDTNPGAFAQPIRKMGATIVRPASPTELTLNWQEINLVEINSTPYGTPQDVSDFINDWEVGYEFVTDNGDGMRASSLVWEILMGLVLPNELYSVVSGEGFSVSEIAKSTNTSTLVSGQGSIVSSISRASSGISTQVSGQGYIASSLQEVEGVASKIDGEGSIMSAMAAKVSTISTKISGQGSIKTKSLRNGSTPVGSGHRKIIVIRRR